MPSKPSVPIYEVVEDVADWGDRPPAKYTSDVDAVLKREAKLREQGVKLLTPTTKEMQEADSAAEFIERQHPRDREGKWARKPGAAVRRLGRTGKAISGPKRVPRKLSPQTAAREEVPEKEWVDPPPPVGRKGESKGGKGYSSDEAYGTNTALGRVGEAAFVKILGGRILHPPGKGEQSPLDVHYDGYGFEVKAVSTKTLGYKATPKKYEQEQKEAYAQQLGLEPALAIVVVDSDTKKAHAYYRDGLASGRLSKARGWQYLGSTDLGD